MRYLEKHNFYGLVAVGDDKFLKLFRNVNIKVLRCRERDCKCRIELFFTFEKFVGFFVNIRTWSYCYDIDKFFTGESINNPDFFYAVAPQPLQFIP